MDRQRRPRPPTELWEQAFSDEQLMWGHEPPLSAVAAAERPPRPERLAV